MSNINIKIADLVIREAKKDPVYLKSPYNALASFRKYLMETLGVSKHTFSHWEREKIKIKLTHFMKLKRLYSDVSTSHCPDYDETLDFSDDAIKKNYRSPAVHKYTDIYSALDHQGGAL